MATDAREVLLKARDQLDALTEENGEPIRVYLAVAYSFESETASFDGVVKSEDPTWISLALLNRAYEAIEQAVEDAGD